MDHRLAHGVLGVAGVDGARADKLDTASNATAIAAFPSGAGRGKIRAKTRRYFLRFYLLQEFSIALGVVGIRLGAGGFVIVGV